MKIMGFALKMLKADWEKNVVYGIVLAINTIVLFLFLNMSVNPNLVFGSSEELFSISRSQYSPSYFKIYLSSIVTFVIMIMSFVMITFLNNFYLSKKGKEIAVLQISGANLIQTSMYLLAQNGVVVLLGMPLGLFVGYLLNPALNKIIYSYLNINGPLWSVSSEALTLTLVCLLTQIVLITMLDASYVYQHELSELVSVQSRKAAKEFKLYRLPHWVFTVAYILSFGILFNQMSVSNSTFFMMVNMVAVLGMFYFQIPSLLTDLMNRKYLGNAKALVILGNLADSIKNSVFLIAMCIITVGAMLCCIGYCAVSPADFILSILGFLIVTLFTISNICFKVCLESEMRKMEFLGMYKIGFLKADLGKIINWEIVLFYGILVLFLSVGVVVMNITLISFSHMQPIFAVIIVVGLIVPILASMAVSYVFYKRSVLKEMEVR